MLNRRTLIAATGAAVLAGPAVRPAWAQNFPRKAIQMIVAFPASRNCSWRKSQTFM